MGTIYYFTEKKVQNYPEAYKWFKIAADKGDAYSQNKLGFIYLNGHGQYVDYKKALDWFEKAAESGEPGAYVSLGMFYLKGNGVEQDYKKAAEFFQKAADYGIAEGQLNLATLYHDGKGIIKDLTKAGELYHQAAINGNKTAQKLLKKTIKSCTYHGKINESQLGDCQIAAATGNPIVLTKLGILYETGTLLEKNYEKAIHLLTLAAKKGHIEAQYLLGMRYYKGDTVPADLKAAYAWLYTCGEGKSTLIGEPFTIKSCKRAAKTIYKEVENKGETERIAKSFFKKYTKQ